MILDIKGEINPISENEYNATISTKNLADDSVQQFNVHEGYLDQVESKSPDGFYGEKIQRNAQPRDTSALIKAFADQLQIISQDGWDTSAVTLDSGNYKFETYFGETRMDYTDPKSNFFYQEYWDETKTPLASWQVFQNHLNKGVPTALLKGVLRFTLPVVSEKVPKRSYGLSIPPFLSNERFYTYPDSLVGVTNISILETPRPTQQTKYSDTLAGKLMTFVEHHIELSGSKNDFEYRITEREWDEKYKKFFELNRELLAENEWKLVRDFCSREDYSIHLGMLQDGKPAWLDRNVRISVQDTVEKEEFSYTSYNGSQKTGLFYPWYLVEKDAWKVFVTKEK